MYSGIADPEVWDRLWATEIHDKWGATMSKIIDFTADGVPDSREVREIFDLHTNAG